MQVVRDFLSPLHWELIESIPLSTSPQDDYYWAWHYEKSGVFSVRSTYRMLVRSWEMLAACAEGRLGRSNVGAQEKKWTELGRTKVPSKVRVLLWRLARHSIPTGDVRHHRNMAANARCVLCGAADSWRHALLECNLAKCVWALENESIVEFLSQNHYADAHTWVSRDHQLT